MDAAQYIQMISKGIPQVPFAIEQKIKFSRSADIAIGIHALGIEPPCEVMGKRYQSPLFDKDYEERFKRKIINRHPNELKELYQFRIASLPTITKDLLIEGVAQYVGSALQSNNFTISINGFETDAIKEELRNKFIMTCIVNPNGYNALCMINPDEYANGGTHKFAIKQFKSKDVKWVSDSFIHIDNGGEYQYIFTKDSQIILDQKGKEIVQWKHNTDDFMCYISGGYWNDLGYYESYFSSFVNIADLLLRNMSDDEVTSKTVYPILQMVAPTCSKCLGSRTEKVACGCENKGNCTQCENTGYKDTQCKTCSGKGKIGYNLGETYIMSAPEGRDNTMYDVAKYINAPVEFIKASSDRVKDLYDKCRKVLFLNQSEGVKSGEAIKLDYEMKYMRYSDITNGILSMHSKLVYWYYAAMFPPVTIKGKVTIGIPDSANFTYTLPTQYGLMSESDLFDVYQKHNVRDADMFARFEAKKAYYKKIYSSDPYLLFKADVLMEYDNYHVYNLSELQGLLAQGIITKEQVQKSINSVITVDRYFKNNPDIDITSTTPTEVASKI